jgi:hypothetical protein
MQERPADTVPSAVSYTKGNFFDEISCEALERKGINAAPKRMDRDQREHQKQIDMETFGTLKVDFSGWRRSGRGSGNFRSGGNQNRLGFRARGAGYSNY